MLKADKLPPQAAWKVRRDVDDSERPHKRMVASGVQVAFGTDCGMFPFDDIYRHQTFDVFRS